MKSYLNLRLSFFIAISVAILSSACIYFLTPSLSVEQLALVGIVIFITCIVMALLFVYFFIQKRINRLYKIMEGTTSFKLQASKPDVFQDVEEEVINRANLREQEMDKLKETEKYRKEFIGNLSHELKTPVFSVQGYILTLLEGGLEDETINRKFLEKASKGIDRIAAVIEDMDTITRIESGILNLNLKRFSIIELSRNILFELEELAENKSIKLVLDVKKGDDFFVNADKLKVTQVLHNLLSNSIHYGNQNGETVVKFKNQKDKVNIKIIDNGPGIEDIHLNRLFERFYRVEQSRNRNKGGSGIGLAIVKHIIEAHGEKISVKSEPNKGTQFTFDLPKG